MIKTKRQDLGNGHRMLRTLRGFRTQKFTILMESSNLTENSESCDSRIMSMNVSQIQLFIDTYRAPRKGQQEGNLPQVPNLLGPPNLKISLKLSKPPHICYFIRSAIKAYFILSLASTVISSLVSIRGIKYKLAIDRGQKNWNDISEATL